MMVPMLDIILGESVDAGIYTIPIGMAHRGPPERAGPHPQQQPCRNFQSFATRPEKNIRRATIWAGRATKHHAGASRSLNGNNWWIWLLSCRLTPATWNTSTRSSPAWRGPPARRPTSRGRPYFDPRAILPVVIHGDAAFPARHRRRNA